MDGGDNLDVNATLIEGTDATDQINAACDAAIETYGLDHLVSASVAGGDVADDSIIAQMVSLNATADWDTFDNTTDSLEALRDRGDAAWITGGGGSITEILGNVNYHVPQAIDLANTATWRIGISFTNSLDDLPTTAEITPGTLSIDRKAQGGTTWSAVETDVAMSESAGQIYFDEVFDTATGYAAGDVLRFTFKSQRITVDANDHEITDATGVIHYGAIIADTPDVNVAQIDGSDTNVGAMNTFFSTLNGSGQIQANSLASNAIQAVKIQDGSLTAAKFATDFLTNDKVATDAFTDDNFAASVTTEFQAGLATSAEITALDTVVDRIETDTQDIQSRIPASLNNGAMVADIQRINDVAIVGDGSGTPFTV